MKTLLTSVFIIFTLALPSYAAGVKDAYIKGGKEYNRGKYGTALSIYSDALKTSPEDERLKYNIAASNYKLKDYDNAVSGYDEVAEMNGARKQDALFNKGNALYRKGDMSGAIEAYREAILLNTTDKAAIHNLQKAIEEKKQDEDSQNKDDEKEDNDSPEGGGGGGGGSDSNSQDNSPSDNKEEIERLMQMASEEESRAKPKSTGRLGSAGNDPEKDW
ncbi:Ca-activated chloride channel family protein [Parelusimicrobium proximum]|uniref:tetratricopeptide repeat protein n=1 Tax=Parelusimicrobium proximum TaxID=3228953 RepID=UPI003D16C6AE